MLGETETKQSQKKEGLLMLPKSLEGRKHLVNCRRQLWEAW